MGSSCQLVDPLDPGDALKKMVIGASAAAVTKTTTAPLDRVKLVLQVQRGQLAMQKYTGMSDCFIRITSDQGLLALWRGNGASVIKCMPTHALNFLLRDIYRGLFLVDIPRSDKWNYFIGSVLAGGCGGATCLLALYPLDFARTRLAVDQKQNGSRRYKGVYDCLRRTRHGGGMKTWYRGFSSAVQFVFVSRAIFFGLFDTIRTGAVKNQRDMSFLITLALAQTCLILSSILSYPLDTVRRRLMIVEGQKHGLRHSLTASKTLAMWKHIISSEGVASFYKGVLPNTIRSSSGALIISLYYEMSKYL